MKKCPFCTAEIPVEAKKCKFCGEWVAPPEPAVEPPEPAAPAEPGELKVTVQPPTRGPTKACPYCSAQIPQDAWTCMYCKRGVVGGRPAAIGMAILGLLVVGVFFFGFWLPGFLKMNEQRKEFDQKWEKTRQEQEQFRQEHFPERQR